MQYVGGKNIAVVNGLVTDGIVTFIFFTCLFVPSCQPVLFKRSSLQLLTGMYLVMCFSNTQRVTTKLFSFFAAEHHQEGVTQRDSHYLPQTTSLYTHPSQSDQNYERL